MITAVFQDHLLFLSIAISLTLISGIFAYYISTRSFSRTQSAFYGLWASSTVGPVILTTWSGSGLLTYRCTVNPAVTEAFSATQGQLNMLLFAPFGLFAVLATRRPLYSASLGILFTAVVETGQATLPFVSRLCDTDDLVTNTAGVLAGAGAGAAICRYARYGKSLSRTAVRGTAIAGGSASLIVGIAWITMIEPVRAVLPTSVPTASPHQLHALNNALKKALGDAVTADEASFHNNFEGPSTVNAPLPGGYAELTWPDQEKLAVHFIPTSQGEGNHAFWIPGASRQVHTAEQAVEVATAYAQRHAPWAVQKSDVRVWPVDADDESLGWVVERRRWHGRILMPMRLDIRIEPSGRMVDLIARNVADPELPPVRIGEQQAWQKFEEQHKIQPGQVDREQPVHLAERREGSWRVHWRLAARSNGSVYSAVVDATTGNVHDVMKGPEGTEPAPAEETMTP